MTKIEYSLFNISLDFTRPASWRDRAVNPQDWEVWDRAMRRALGWRAGLRFWRKTNVPKDWILISRHWPHRLCWTWCVSVGLHRNRYDGMRCFRLVVTRPHRLAELKLFGPYIRISWQDYDRMVASNYRDRAPRIIWKHEIERAQEEAAEATLQ